MKKFLYQFFVGMLLFYCCILFYGETKVRADLREADQKREAAVLESGRSEQRLDGEESDGFYNWRYMKIHINENICVKADLFAVAGVLTIVSAVILVRDH